jgi:hypothetical protein
VKLFPNGGSALEKPNRDHSLILLSREKLTRMDDPEREPPA